MMEAIHPPRGRHVYFVQAVDGGLIKIGAANDPAKRLRLLQANCPVRLRFIGLIRDGWYTERWLHHRFDHLREHGEWFRPTPDLLAYITEHATSEQEGEQATAS